MKVYSNGEYEIHVQGNELIVYCNSVIVKRRIADYLTMIMFEEIHNIENNIGE